METSGIGSTSATTAASTTAGMAGALTGTGSLGKEEFLKLLVTQLRSQNPLDPMGNEAFVAQLAQFGALEQMQNVASATETSTRVLGSVNNAVATSFIGREAVAANDAFTWNGEAGSVDLGALLPSGGSAQLNVLDTAGNTVASLTLHGGASGPALANWDGKGSTGAALPAGQYRLEVSATDGQGIAITAQPIIAGVVEGVSFQDGATYLSVGGTRVPLSAVAEINQ